MKDVLSLEEYRQLIKSGAAKKKSSSTLCGQKTGDRISSLEYKKSLTTVRHATDKYMQATPKTQPGSGSAPPPSPKSLIKKDLHGKGLSDRFTRVIDSIQKATPEGRITPGRQVSFSWAGMSLLSLNELLRCDHRGSGMSRYRKACHNLVTESAVLVGKTTNIPMFDAPVRLRIRRSGNKLIDTDGLYAAFKFLIDGFRSTGFIPDDDPTTIIGMTHHQTIGPASIGIDLYRADLAPKRVIIESPFAGNTDLNIRYAKACMLDSLQRGEAPMASHILYASSKILRDDLPEERKQGMEAGFSWFHGAELHAVYTDIGISPGMEEGVARAAQSGLQTEYRALPFWRG